MIIGHVGRSRKRLRFHRLFALLGALLLALAVASLPSPAAAHGVAMGPGSRTYLCYLDLLQNESTQMPSNPACRAAVQGAGTTPLYNWFAVLDSNAGGRSVGYVPDGKLCSAGDRSPYNFSPTTRPAQTGRRRTSPRARASRSTTATGHTTRAGSRCTSPRTAGRPPLPWHGVT